MPWKVSPLIMIEDMRQRSRLYSINLAQILPTHAHTNPLRHTVKLATHTHARTNARTHAHLGVHCSGPRRSLRPKLQAPPRCGACVTALCHSETGNRRHATRSSGRHCRRRHARDNVQEAIDNRQQATRCNVTRCDRERAADTVQRSHKGQRARGHWQMCNTHRDGHHATCNMHRGKQCNRRHNPCN